MNQQSKARQWFVLPVLLGMFIMFVGCPQSDQPEGASPDSGEADQTAADFENFEIEKPPAFTGEFNPKGLEVGLAVGKLAPEIEGEDLDGTPFKLSDYRGKVVMLDFWGDW